MAPHPVASIGGGAGEGRTDGPADVSSPFTDRDRTTMTIVGLLVVAGLLLVAIPWMTIHAVRRGRSSASSGGGASPATRQR